MFQIHQYLEPDDDAEAGQQKNVPDSTISKDLSSILRTIKASGLEAVCKRLEESKQLGQKAKCRRLEAGL